MRFEARELNVYAEPIGATDLQKGDVYFSLQFADDKMLIPIVQPLIYLGSNLNEGDRDLFYLQDFESYSNGVRYSTHHGGTDSDFEVRGLSDLNHIFEYERALDSLMKCSLRRREWKNPHRD